LLTKKNVNNGNVSLASIVSITLNVSQQIIKSLTKSDLFAH